MLPDSLLGLVRLPHFCSFVLVQFQALAEANKGQGSYFGAQRGFPFGCCGSPYGSPNAWQILTQSAFFIKMTKKLPLVVPDSPTAQGNVYTSLALKAAFDEKEALIKDRMFLGTIGRPVITTHGLTRAFQADALVPLSEASHLVTEIVRENNVYLCTIEVLDTPSGKKLKELIDGPGIELKMAGSSDELKEIGSYRYITKYKLASINAVPLEPALS